MSHASSRTLAVSIGRFLILLCFMSFAQMVMAQSTIFNIPSTDTVAAKKGYAEFDYLAEMPAPSGARNQIFVPRIVVGIAPNVEAGANFLFSHTPGFTSDVFQPNIKWKFAHNDEKGLAGSAGIIWYTPINHRTGADSFGVVYGNFSKKVKGTYGPRVTLGPYGIVGTAEGTPGTKAGAIVGWEQPIQAKVSIVADWFSGVSGFGYFTPGISITLPHSSLFNAGYSIGNNSYNSTTGNKDNRYLFLYYGITFP